MTAVIEKIFDSLDVDKDGSICQTELEGIFKLFDEDGEYLSPYSSSTSVAMFD